MGVTAPRTPVGGVVGVYDPLKSSVTGLSLLESGKLLSRKQVSFGQIFWTVIYI